MSIPLAGRASELLSNEDALREGIRNGQCHIVSLAPVRDALGQRWPKNEVLVEDFVLRTFKRGSLPDDLIIKFNAVDYVLIQPSRSAISALSRVTMLTRMTLNHFLGQAPAEQIRVSIIEQAEPGQISARRVTRGQIEAASLAPSIEADTPIVESLAPVQDDSPPWEPFGSVKKPRKVVIYKRPEGGELEAVYYCEPIWNSTYDAVAVFQLRTQTFHIQATHRAPVTPDDLTARTHGVIATRRLRHAREVLTQTDNQNLAISVPLSLDAFAHSSSRIAIMHKLRKIADNAHTKGRLLIEICDLPCNVSSVRVAEAVAQIKGFVRRATVRLPTHGIDYSEWAKTGADGLILPIQTGLSEYQLRQQISSLTEQVRRYGGFAAIDGIHTPGLAAMAYTCGLKELAGDQVTNAFGNLFDVRPLTLQEILSARPSA